MGTEMSELSPTAAAVMSAGTMGNPNLVNDMVYRQCIAAALRTAANHVISPDSLMDMSFYNRTRIDIRHEFLSIAAELEGTNV
jgi:hypothetical protein